ncbi:UNVERIFIED_CONTAM: hypothetical protein FKN15_023389 [Acipenser sinensis]
MLFLLPCCRWHRVALSVQKKDVTLILDCKKRITKPLPRSDKPSIDTKGIVVFGSRILDEEVFEKKSKAAVSHKDAVKAKPKPAASNGNAKTPPKNKNVSNDGKAPPSKKVPPKPAAATPVKTAAAKTPKAKVAAVKNTVSKAPVKKSAVAAATATAGKTKKTPGNSYQQDVSTAHTVAGHTPSEADRTPYPEEEPEAGQELIGQGETGPPPVAEEEEVKVGSEAPAEELFTEEYVTGDSEAEAGPGATEYDYSYKDFKDYGPAHDNNPVQIGPALSAETEEGGAIVRGVKGEKGEPAVMEPAIVRGVKGEKGEPAVMEPGMLIEGPPGPEGPAVSVCLFSQDHFNMFTRPCLSLLWYKSVSGKDDCKG